MTAEEAGTVSSSEPPQSLPEFPESTPSGPTIPEPPVRPDEDVVQMSAVVDTEAQTQPVITEPVQNESVTRAVGHGGGEAEKYLQDHPMPVTDPNAKAIATADTLDAQKKDNLGETTVRRIFNRIARWGK